jgi:hypothetical protein
MLPETVHIVGSAADTAALARTAARKAGGRRFPERVLHRAGDSRSRHQTGRPPPAVVLAGSSRARGGVSRRAAK